MQRSPLNLLLAIIHGDIKPQNVLIFKDNHGTYTPRLTDFGYSTWFASEDETIGIPTSWPWNAPEYDRCSVRPSQAKNMDVFSLGMLCLWVLFEKYFCGKTPLPQAASWANELFAQTSNLHSIEFILDTLKHQDKLVLLAQQFLDAENTVKTGKMVSLSQFLISALSCDPDRREAKLQQLVDVLAPHR